MNENSSCSKVSTPEPAQHLSISAVKNGWLVGVDASYASGCLGKPYVYTRPEEVAGAVLGLIVAGYPVPAVYPGPQQVTLCNIDEEKEKSRAEGFEQCRKQASDALPKAKEAAYNDGYVMGQRNANEAADSRAVAHAYDQGVAAGQRNAGESRVTATQVNEAEQRGYIRGQKEEHDSFYGRRPWNEIFEQGKLIARHEETHRKLQTELDERANLIALLQTETHRLVECLRHRDNRLEELKNEVDKLQRLLDLTKAALSSARDEVKTSNERINARMMRGDKLFINCFTEETPVTATFIRDVVFDQNGQPLTHFRVGDVWTSANGHVRTITAVREGSVQYQHFFGFGKPSEDSCTIGPGHHSMSWLEAVGTDVTLLRK